MYIYCLTQAKTLNYYKKDPSSRQGERLTTNKTETVLLTTNIWSRALEGPNAKMD
jgi:hypothetical protein